MLSFGNKDIDRLSDKQLTTFIFIVNHIIDNGSLTISNKEIAAALKLPVSTLEKHLKLLADRELIVRTNTRARNGFGVWETTSRVIRLNPRKYDPKVLTELYNQRLMNLIEVVTSSEYTEKIIKRLRNSRV